MITDLIGEGLAPDDATHLVNEADLWRKQERRKSGQVRFTIGTGLAILGGFITLGSWYLAGPGGTYLVTTGLIGVGALTALWGMFKTLTSTSSAASFTKYFVTFAVVIGIVGGGGGFLFSKTMAAPLSDPPPDSSVGWVPDEPEFTPMGIDRYTVTLSGTVTNMDADWFIVDAIVEVMPVDSRSNKKFDVIKVLVQPERIGPGEDGRYASTVALPRYAGGFDGGITWAWGK